jgi:hypothetical protein
MKMSIKQLCFPPSMESSAEQFLQNFTKLVQTVRHDTDAEYTAFSAGVTAVAITLRAQTPETLRGVSGVDVQDFIKECIKFSLSFADTSEDAVTPPNPVKPENVN